MGAIFRFLAIGILVYWLIRAFSRMFGFGAQNNAYNQDQRGNQNYGNQRTEGSINVDKRPRSNKNRKMEGGEYVDFEEVE